MYESKLSVTVVEIQSCNKLTKRLNKEVIRFLKILISAIKIAEISPVPNHFTPHQPPSLKI